MLNQRATVPLPTSGIIIRRNGKYQYVFKVLRTFRNDKGQPTNTRVSIGRLDADGTKLIPNNNYFEYYEPGESLSYASDYESVISLGAAFVVDHILTKLGVTRFLDEALGRRRTQSVITAATYMVCEGNVFDHITDWCENSLIGRSTLTPQIASSLFASITRDERMAFFKKWIRKHGLSGYFSYDVTSFSSYAEGIRDLEWGYNRDGDRLPQLNLGCYLAQESCLPMFYVTYPGSIVDKSYLPYMMIYNDELGIGNSIIFVMDRGFCSTDNINYMHEAGLLYVMGADTRTKATRAAIDEVISSGNQLSLRYQVSDGVFAHSAHSRFFGEQTTLHIYHSPSLGDHQRSDLMRVIVNMEHELAQLRSLSEKERAHYSRYFDIAKSSKGLTYSRNYDRIDVATRYCGTFCILSNTDITIAEILRIFRRKDTIEKGFDDIKNHIEMKRLRAHSDATIEGKLFCAFIALIAATVMTNKLRDYNETSSRRTMSKRKLITELEKIRVCETAGAKRLLHPLTKTQRELLELFDASLDDIRLYVNQPE